MTCQASRVGAWPDSTRSSSAAASTRSPAAALLAKDGWRVCVLERNDWLGGAIKTVDGLTAPGFRHEVFASWHPLWVGSPAYAELKPDLDRARPRVPEHRPADGDRVPRTDRARSSPPTARANVAQLGPSVAAAVRRVHGRRRRRLRRARHRALVAARGSRSAERPTASSAAAGSSSSPGTRCSSARDWLTDTFADERAHGLLAPWVLHTGLGPDQAMSGFMTQVIACALQLGGMPVPKGGGASLVEALAAIVRDAGGELRTEADVERIVVADGHGDRRPARRRRDDRGYARRPRLRHADAALRPPARRERRAGGRRASGAPLPLRPRRDADPHRDDRAARAGAATSGSRGRRSST